jgi:hypothetical protein
MQKQAFSGGYGSHLTPKKTDVNCQRLPVDTRQLQLSGANRSNLLVTGEIREQSSKTSLKLPASLQRLQADFA